MRERKMLTFPLVPLLYPMLRLLHLIVAAGKFFFWYMSLYVQHNNFVQLYKKKINDCRSAMKICFISCIMSTASRCCAAKTASSYIIKLIFNRLFSVSLCS